MTADLDPPTMSESTACALIVCETIEDVTRWLMDVEHERQRLQVGPGGVPADVAADLLAKATALGHVVGAFRDVAQHVVLTAALNGPVVTSDGGLGWRRENSRSTALGGNARLVPLTHLELGELT